MFQRNFIVNVIILVLLLLAKIDAKNTVQNNDSTSLQSSAIDSFFQKLDNSFRNSLAACLKDTSGADSIAISFLDTLNEYGDRLYDLYNSMEALRKNKDDTSIGIDFESRLKKYGIVSIVLNGDRVFKGSPEIVLCEFLQYFSKSGKTFFQTRIKDQLQSCLYDDEIVLLPWDTIGERLQMWDGFSTATKNSYASKRGDEYLKRYLSMYLSFYRNSGAGYVDHGIMVDNIADSTKQRYSLYVNKYGSSRTGKIVSEYLKIINQFEKSTDSIPNALVSLFKKYNIPDVFFTPKRKFTTEILEPIKDGYSEEDVGVILKSNKWLALVRSSADEWSLKPVNLKYKKGYFNLSMES